MSNHELNQPESEIRAATPPSAETTTEPETNSETRTQPYVPKVNWKVRLSVLLSVSFVAWHVFATFLWVAPVTELRKLTPGDSLERYMIPMFGQSWSVFAPEPINGDYSLHVRAKVEENGKISTTDWVDASAVEQSMANYNLLPHRGSGGAWQQSSKFKNSWASLNDSQKQLALSDYYQEGWEMTFATDIRAKSDNANRTQEFLNQDWYTTAYATQVSRAVWGPNVVQVQWLSGRQNIIPFAQRHNPDAERPKKEVAETGWRGVVTFPGQSDERFTEIFRPQYEKLMRERSGKEHASTVLGSAPAAPLSPAIDTESGVAQ